MYRQIIAQGRRLGKSTMTIEHLQDIILRQHSIEMQRSIDQAIIDELYDNPPPTYYIHKSWTERSGRGMHRISVSGRVLEWLEKEQSQYAIKNPDWWHYYEMINISDRLLSLLILKWGKE